MTPAAFRSWLEDLAECGATLPAAAVLERCPDFEETPATALVVPVETTWRERLWFAPSEARLNAHEVAEALGRSASWVYKRTGTTRRDDDPAPLPCRRMDGSLVFLAGELRAWIRDHEESVIEGPSDPPMLRAIGAAGDRPARPRRLRPRGAR